MPELLDDELARVREDLFGRIQLPGLAGARHRAGKLRRRRRLAAGSAVLVGVLLVVGIVANDPDPAPRPPVTPAESAPAGPYWRGSGITLHGLEAPVTDQPGVISGLEFNDRDHGFVLTMQCQASCFAAVAATSDGGRTWTDWPLIQSNVHNDGQTLIPIGKDAVVLRGLTSWYGWDRTWRPVDTTDPPTVTRIPAGAALAVSPEGNLEVWRSDGTLARLPGPGGFVPCFGEPVPAGDGTWWLGGTAQGQPAVAHSVDSGQTWQVTPLPTGGTFARVSTLGRETYASVETVRPGQAMRIEAVYRSVDGGPFTLFAERPGTVSGEVVPLLDGRLLVAGPDWYVGTGTLTRAGGSLPWVGEIERTPGGWVAYDLFAADWAAVSRDGIDWQKVNVR